jgi:hypothetical protein
MKQSAASGAISAVSGGASQPGSLRQPLAAPHQVGGSTTPQDFILGTFDRAGVPWKNE